MKKCIIFVLLILNKSGVLHKKKYLLYFILFVIFFSGCNVFKYDISSIFFVEDDYLYYAYETGELYKYSLENKAKEKVIDNLFLRAYNDKYFIGYSNNTIKVLNRENGDLYEIKDIILKDLDILNDDIFYINKKDNNFIYKVNIYSMENVKFLEESTNKLSVNSNYIFYEMNLDYIYKYSFITKKNEKVFSGKYCFYFYCDDYNIYISDYLNDNKIVKININSNEKESLFEISTIAFFVKGHVVYYIPLIDEDIYSSNNNEKIYMFDNTSNENKLLI